MARGRPRKSLLSSELIVDTAMRLIDDGELLNLSRIARELSVHVSSLYNHVGDREGLIELLRLRIAEEYPVPPLDGLIWQETIRAVASTIHAAFAAHPGLIPYLATTPVSAPEITTVYTKLAESMLHAGHTPTSAARSIRMLDSLALGTALVTSSEPPAWTDDSEGGRALIGALPHWGDELALTNDAFARGLEFLIAGLEHDLAAELATEFAAADDPGLAPLTR